MYITRFSTVSKETQDYYYHKAEDAEKHLDMFRDDNSELYRNICVFDEKNRTVLKILPFENGKPQEPIYNGQVVKIRHNWCSPGEEKYRFRVSNIHEDTERVCISCINSKLVLGSSEIVDLNMIIPA